MDKLRMYLPLIFLGALVAGAVVVWSLVLYVEGRAGYLALRIFDIGQGDGIFAEFPDGNQILIDGGPDGSILAKLGSTMLPWDRSIDAIILTHPHADHVSGLLEVLKRYHVGLVIESDAQYGTPEYSEWHKLLIQKEVPVVRAEAGMKLEGRQGTFLFLAPQKDYSEMPLNNVHDAMIVMKLSYASTSVLLTGDMERKLEYSLLRNGSDLHADVLKVGHHGSKTSTSDDFLKAVSPAYAVISAGRKNTYGHPTQEVLNRLAAFGTRIFRTDQDGDVTFISDGSAFVTP